MYGFLTRHDMCILVRYYPGDLGLQDYNMSSTTNLVCLQLLTDGTVSAAGFNATYTKIYAGTDLKGEWIIR